ncbi:cobalt ABC transporter ATP-binding protein [Actinotalea ferrariae CF5-4]|uniref:Cobalt ABC transporter ATP-binding protein n=1 Tax=Actinotalea ferrariae CF5-4 TaxID=948458 RepID=A0A021VMV2_9CELL|nr:ABC transporter ATP-binding protein [Actinotalea ferrariae]EYR62544.1 cobalt ABC transporter ATP-binding protein [Actinotalea ferrariae CF5-4]
MIRFTDVTVTYPGGRAPALRDVDLEVGEGELCLVVGPTGSGKSTLLRAACGLVPHFTGGLLAGAVTVAGRDTRTHPPRDLADVVGVVLQHPADGFVTDSVEEELAYGMEQLGLAPAVMRKRVEEVVDLMGLSALRHRPLGDLSGGEQQRVAIGAVLAAHPRVLVLDEPTSALDPAAAEEVLSALTRLVHDLGLTVLLAEHRLERVVQYADRVVLLGPDGTVRHGDPAPLLADSPVAPPIVELGRLAGWSPLPLSVRDARRRAAPLRERLGSRPVTGPARGTRPAVVPSGRATAAPDPITPRVLLEATGVHVRHGRVHAVRDVSLRVAAGQTLALMGRNGAGKSSLLWALQGAAPRSAGRVAVGADGADPARLAPREQRRRVALVPQEPQVLLYLPTVAAECAAGDRQAGAPAGTTAALLGRLTGPVPPDAHPRDLSEGQRLGLVLAVQLAARPEVLLLDEPTRGLDYAAKRHLRDALAAHTAAGGAVVLSSHDVEFVAECADRVALLAEGEFVADGTAREVLVASPTFAPQVARILHPAELLTVADVAAALAVTA